MSDAANGSPERTRRFHVDEGDLHVRRVLLDVIDALQKKGYDPVKQLIGYLLSGDPTYITSHGGARSLIRSLDRDQVMEELIVGYLRDHLPPAEPRSLA